MVTITLTEDQATWLKLHLQDYGEHLSMKHWRTGHNYEESLELVNGTLKALGSSLEEHLRELYKDGTVRRGE